MDDVVVPVTEELPGRVADGSEPTVDTGLDPVEPVELLDEFESLPVVDEESVDPDDVVVDPDDVVVDPDDVAVDPDDVFVEPDDEFVDPEDELDDSDELDDESESFGAANAAPIPEVPTSPTTPSEKARAPARNACFCEFTYSPNTALDP